MKRFLAISAASLALAGCATGTGGSRWYAPATWFSHAPADTADKAAKKEDAARDAVIKAAQRSAHETTVALQSAPASRPVAVASEFAAEATALLDQAAGPLDAPALAKLRGTVEGLLSDNAELRASAEKARATDAAAVAAVSAKLARAEAATNEAQAKLRTAYDRENALANDLRAQRAMLWIAGGVAVLGCAGYVYLRIVVGGLPSALGMARKALEREAPDLAAKVAPFYARHLDRHEQAIISKFSK